MEERMKGRKKGGEEFNFPPFARHTRARKRERRRLGREWNRRKGGEERGERRKRVGERS